MPPFPPGMPVADRTSDAMHVVLNPNDLEKWAIREALRQAHGKKSEAVQILGISRETPYRKLRECGLDLELPGAPA